jgi:hypothetical protein
MLPGREAMANRAGERWRAVKAEDLTPQRSALRLLQRCIIEAVANPGNLSRRTATTETVQERCACAFTT